MARNDQFSGSKVKVTGGQNMSKLVNDILITEEPIMLQNGTGGPQGKGIKQTNFVGQEVKGQGHRRLKLDSAAR